MDLASAQAAGEMRLLVCGDRDWDDPWIVARVLHGIYDRYRASFTLIEGCAPGADRAAEEWAAGLGGHDRVRHEHYPSDPQRHGRAASPIRNRRMLAQGRPTLVVAFHDDLAHGEGTADMVAIAKAAGVPVYVVGRA